MASITIVLLLLLLVVASGFIMRALPWPVPLPVVQIALGAVVAGASDFHVALNPEIFFLLFLPPLLFLDGWQMPKAALRRDGKTIVALAFGLVFFTVLGMGYFLHWIIPDMPLTVAFALAAVLSPTDPVAVSSIASRVRIPERMLHILEGESLFNDASGLVCLRFAVAATMTGVFSLVDAAGSFVWLVAGGLGTGVAVTIGVALVKGHLGRRYGEETGTEVLISLLLPFGAYMCAEHLGCSGILAAVAAGVTMSVVESSGQVLAMTRVRRTAVWRTVHFAANGIIFVLLGQQWPLLAGQAAGVLDGVGFYAWGKLVWLVLCTFGGIALLRCMWVWVSLHYMAHRARKNGETPPVVTWRMVAAMSVAGVRGAITLAGVLTLPLTLTDGTPFPAREMAVFLAASVIVVSLISASLLLPRLLRNISPDENMHRSEEERARLEAAKAAIAAIEEEQHKIAHNQPDPDLCNDAALHVMHIYRRRIDAGLDTGIAKEAFRRTENVERVLRLAALRAERNVYFRLARQRVLEDDVMRRLVRELDLEEARHAVI